MVILVVGSTNNFSVASTGVNPCRQQHGQDDLVFGSHLGTHGEFLGAGRLTHGRAGAGSQLLSFSTWALKISFATSAEEPGSSDGRRVRTTTLMPPTLPSTTISLGVVPVVLAPSSCQMVVVATTSLAPSTSGSGSSSTFMVKGAEPTVPLAEGHLCAYSLWWVLPRTM